MSAVVRFVHIPVLMDAVLDAAQAAIGAATAAHDATPLMVDCTIGGAGHAQALLDAFPQARLLGLDRDPSAIAVAQTRLAAYGARVQLQHAQFGQLGTVLQGAALGQPAFILADFGVSSHQIDTPDRGFSFRSAGPLDMRMDPGAGDSVATLLQNMDEKRLAQVIRDLGEERHARRVARAIVTDLPQTTQDLAALVRRVVPQGADRIDPATRTFQALRMFANDELGEIGAWLDTLPHVLADHGVACAISFHSLEDRAVKVALRHAANPCLCPPKLPVCVCGKKPTLQRLWPKARVASAAELNSNPRARSARARAAQRLVRSA